jgi:hypothetical protein
MKTKQPGSFGGGGGGPNAMPLKYSRKLASTGRFAVVFAAGTPNPASIAELEKSR